jgi:hypothetical protein
MRYWHLLKKLSFNYSFVYSTCSPNVRRLTEGASDSSTCVNGLRKALRWWNCVTAYLLGVTLLINVAQYSDLNS